MLIPQLLTKINKYESQKQYFIVTAIDSHAVPDISKNIFAYFSGA